MLSVTFVYILSFRSKNLLNGIWGKTRRCILQENLLNIIQLPLITDQVQLITFCVNCLRGELRLQNKFLNASLLFSFNCCFFIFRKKSRISRSWKRIMMQYQCYVPKNGYMFLCVKWLTTWIFVLIEWILCVNATFSSLVFNRYPHWVFRSTEAYFVSLWLTVFS